MPKGAAPTVAAGPTRYAEHLTRARYHPRANKHGDFLAQAVVLDVVAASPEIRAAAAAGKLVYCANFNIEVADKAVADQLPPEARRDLAWNMDLVIGPPPDRAAVSRKISVEKAGIVPPDVMKRVAPSEIWLALDAKGVMTEHGKARRNRQRDVTALWTVMKTFMPNVVVGAVIPVNIAGWFWSPLRGKDEGGQEKVTVHVNIERLVSDTLAIFRAVRLTSRGGRRIDGLGCFVVDFDNIGAASPARIVQATPAPQAGDPIFYGNFVKDLADALVERFGPRFS